MKTPEDFLKDKEEIAQIQGIDFNVIIFNDAVSAMKEYADYVLKLKPECKHIRTERSGFVDQSRCLDCGKWI